MTATKQITVDVGAHVVAVLEHVAGPIRRVLAADSRTMISDRPARGRDTGVMAERVRSRS
jgi:hypothetical protein